LADTHNIRQDFSAEGAISRLKARLHGFLNCKDLTGINRKSSEKAVFFWEWLTACHEWVIQTPRKFNQQFDFLS
jgi:hypothetical protein